MRLHVERRASPVLLTSPARSNLPGFHGADCNRWIGLEFDVDSEAGRANSLHKLDTLLAALRVFREGVVAEFEPYDHRERELAEQQD